MSLLPLRSKRERERKKKYTRRRTNASPQSTDKGAKVKKMEKAHKCRDTTTGNGTVDRKKCAKKVDRKSHRGGGGGGSRASPLRGRVVAAAHPQDTHTHTLLS